MIALKRLPKCGTFEKSTDFGFFSIFNKNVQIMIKFHHEHLYHHFHHMHCNHVFLSPMQIFRTQNFTCTAEFDQLQKSRDCLKFFTFIPCMMQLLLRPPKLLKTSKKCKNYENDLSQTKLFSLHLEMIGILQMTSCLSMDFCICH